MAILPKTIQQQARYRKLLAERKLQRAVPCKEPNHKWVEDTRERLLGKTNAPETHVFGLLSALDVNFKRERCIEVNGRLYFIDFLVTSTGKGNDRKKMRVAVEIDGGYHMTSAQKALDAKRDKILLRTSRVWSVLRIKSDIAMQLTAADLLLLIEGQQKGQRRILYKDLRPDLPA